MARSTHSHPTRPAPHRGDGGDRLGRELELSITIAPDGTLLFGDLTADLLPVAAALCPDDPILQARIAAARGFAATSAASPSGETTP